MNDQDINEFIQTFTDFMNHAEKWEEAKQYTEMFYEQKAAELEITVDYYLAEFV